MKSLLLALVLVPLLSACSIVGPGERGVRVTMGKAAEDTKDPGPYLVFPFITGIRTVSVQTLKHEVVGTAASRDMQNVTTKVAINWTIDPTQVSKIVRDFGDEEDLLHRVIEPAVNEVLKQATAKKPVEEVLTKRAELKAEIDAEIASRLTKYGVIVKDVSIVDIQFSEEFTKSIERKQIAEQEAKRAEYDAQKATMEARAVVNKATGDAEAQKLLKATITDDVLRLRAIEKWDGALPKVMGSGVMPMIDLRDDVASTPKRSQMPYAPMQPSTHR